MTPLQLAIKEIDSILVQFEDPMQELFLRYQGKDKEEQEVFVMALSGEIGILRKRLQVAAI